MNKKEILKNLANGTKPERLKAAGQLAKIAETPIITDAKKKEWEALGYDYIAMPGYVLIDDITQ